MLMFTTMLAVAVLEATSVTKVTATPMIAATPLYFYKADSVDRKPTKKIRFEGTLHLIGISLRATSWCPMYLERPVCLVASARAKPPPRRRITPQGRRFSTGKYFSEVESGQPLVMMVSVVERVSQVKRTHSREGQTR